MSNPSIGSGVEQPGMSYPPPYVPPPAPGRQAIQPVWVVVLGSVSAILLLATIVLTGILVTQSANHRDELSEAKDHTEKVESQLDAIKKQLGVTQKSLSDSSNIADKLAEEKQVIGT